MITNSQIGDAMFKISRCLRDEMVFRSFASHLSLLQLHALLLLKQHEQLSMREIAENFHVEMATVTSLINKLVKLKLVRRKADSKDRRIVRAVLTTKGKAVLEEALQQKQKKFTMMLGVLSSQEKKELFTILEKILKAYDK